MSEELADYVGVTIKAAPGHEAPWITPRASTVAGMKELLQEMEQDEEFVAIIARLSRAFGAVYLGSSPTPQAARQAAPQAQPQVPQQAQPQAPAPQPQNVKFCSACGSQMEFKSGQKKNGQGTWSGHFCPQDKSHPVQWGA